MAFVSPLSVSAARSTAPALRASPVAPLRRPDAAPAAAASTPRMGYGDYLYLTDKTKGHVNQYYVDKFRVAADFIKGAPASDADAKLGRTMKGGVAVPAEGVPQPAFDTALLPVDAAAPADPRVAEADGVVWAWDKNYADPAFAPDTYADGDDAATAGAAFAAFRESVNADRGAALTAMDFGAVARVQRIKDGLDADYLCSLDGQLDAQYARLQKVADPAVLSPTGVPQTEIPGTEFLSSVGAMDLMDKPGDSVAFWKGDAPEAMPYKRPSGADTPELPYNTSPSVGDMQSAQSARGLLPADE